MNPTYFMIDENALPRGRWFLGDFRSTDFQDRKRLDRHEPCKGIFTIDPGTGGRALNFSLTAFGLPIATLPLAEAISRIVGDYVYMVPARIKGYGEFRFLQILRALDCVDEARAIFERYDDDAPAPSRRGEYSSFTKLVVDTSRIPVDVHMFHIAKWHVGIPPLLLTPS